MKHVDIDFPNFSNVYELIEFCVRRLCEINGTDPVPLLNLIFSNDIEVYRIDYATSSTVIRCSTNKREQEIFCGLYVATNGSCTRRNLILVNKLMIALGYHSYERNPRRFRYMVENVKKNAKRKSMHIND